MAMKAVYRRRIETPWHYNCSNLHELINIELLTDRREAGRLLARKLMDFHVRANTRCNSMEVHPHLELLSERNETSGSDWVSTSH